MVCIDHDTSTVRNSDYARFSKVSWYTWCLKNNIDIIFNETHDPRFGRPIWNKELIYEIGKGYDKIGIIDSDTMIRPDSPNPFDLFNETEFCGVNDLCDLNWLMSSIDVYQKFFPEVKMDIFKYLNAGVLFFGNKYLYIFEKLLNLYLNNKTELDAWDKGGGREQTLLNFTLQSEQIPIKLLTPAWNLLSLHRKNMLVNNWQLHPEFRNCVDRQNVNSWPHFMRYGNIWHFTGFAPEERASLMSTVWDIVKQPYNHDENTNKFFEG